MTGQAQIYIRQLRYDEARQKLLSEIERLFFAGVREVEIVHGIGDYILRRMAQAELQKLDYVRINTEWNANPGILRVTLLTPDEGILAEYRG